MGPTTGFPCAARQLGYQTDDVITDIPGTRRQYLGAQIAPRRRLADRLRRLHRDNPHSPLHLGKRRLHVQHPLEIRALIEHRAHRVAAIQRAQNGSIGWVGGHETSPEQFIDGYENIPGA